MRSARLTRDLRTSLGCNLMAVMSATAATATRAGASHRGIPAFPKWICRLAWAERTHGTRGENTAPPPHTHTHLLTSVTSIHWYDYQVVGRRPLDLELHRWNSRRRALAERWDQSEHARPGRGRAERRPRVWKRRPRVWKRWRPLEHENDAGRYFELQYKCQLHLGFSIADAEIAENCP